MLQFLRGNVKSDSPRGPDSCGGMLTQFLYDGRATANELYRTLTTQKVELMLTAHPTKVNHRTLLAKHLRVQEYLLESDRIAEESNYKDGYGYEQRLLQQKLEREISLLDDYDSDRFCVVPTTIPD